MMLLRDRCSSIRHNLAAFVDDELNGEARLRVARHLETCADCADEAEVVRMVGETLRASATHEPPQDHIAGLASSVVSRFKAESEESWRGFVDRACDGWHWTIVGSGSLAATFVTTSILSLILTFGPAPQREDSLSALMTSLGSPAGYFFVYVSAEDDDQDMSLLQIANGRPMASRMVAALAVPASHRPMTEAEMVRELATAVTRDGRVLSLGAMDPEARRRTEALLDDLTRLRSIRRSENVRSVTVREVRLVTSVTAKRL